MRAAERIFVFPKESTANLCSITILHLESGGRSLSVIAGDSRFEGRKINASRRQKWRCFQQHRADLNDEVYAAGARSHFRIGCYRKAMSRSQEELTETVVLLEVKGETVYGFRYPSPYSFLLTDISPVIKSQAIFIESL